MRPKERCISCIPQQNILPHIEQRLCAKAFFYIACKDLGCAEKNELALHRPNFFGVTLSRNVAAVDHGMAPV